MLQGSGRISAYDINVELQRTTNWSVVLDDQYFRNFAGKPGAGTRISYSDFWGKSSYTPMVGTGVNYYVQGTSSTTSSGSWSGAPSVNVTGGSGGLTFQWAITAGLGTLYSATAQTCNVTRTVIKNGSALGTTTLQVTVTDNTGHQIVVTGITVSWDVENNM